MDLKIFRWKIYVWIQTQILCRVVLGVENGINIQLTERDVSLLASEENPKCFTRTQYDFTCFLEVSNEKTFYFFYKNDDGEKLCDLIRQKMDNGTVLHICSFPASDVYLYTLIHIKVVDNSTGRIAYESKVSIEEQVLLDPPENVSLSDTEEAGKLLVTWSIPAESENKVKYGIRYSHGSMAPVTKPFNPSRSSAYILDSIVAGSVCQVQLRLKPEGYGMSGHWSDWSHPTIAMVPQQAADIDLVCHTADLQNIQCQWTEKMAGKDAPYNLLYKIIPSACGCWQECSPINNTAQCVFPGEVPSIMRVNLRTGSDRMSRSFYTEPFKMSNIIKTEPPQNLSWEAETTRLCLRWEPPLQSLSGQLVFQIRYTPKGDIVWKLVTLQSSNTSTYLDLQAGGQYSIQVRAKPDGSIYSGTWSDWSNKLTVDVPSDTGTLLLACIPFILFIITILLVASFSRYFSKIKHHLWPPVPNLDKVLENILTDINRQWQGQTFNIKQCYEDSPASVVEIVSNREALGIGKTKREGVIHLLADTTQGELEQCIDSLEACPDYVTLDTRNDIPCLRRNEYVREEGKPMNAEVEVLQVKCHCSCSRSSGFLDSSMDILNQSYLLLAEPSEDLVCRGVSGVTNRYTNLENTARQSSID